MISKQELHEIFDFKDGFFYWKIEKGTKIKPGDRVNIQNHNKGYNLIYIKRKYYLVHRIVFLYHYGYIPEYIDHIDGNRKNNTLENLRESTLAQNNQNAKIRKNNSSGIKGIDYHKGKWRARCRFQGKQYHLGLFDDVNDAVSKLDEFRKIHHKQFSNDGKYNILMKEI